MVGAFTLTQLKEGVPVGHLEGGAMDVCPGQTVTVDLT